MDNTKLTLLISIVLTASATAGGTYYLTTNTTLATVEAQAQAGNGHLEGFSVNQDPDKPITIIVKTEGTEHHKQIPDPGNAEKLKRPRLAVTPGP